MASIAWDKWVEMRDMLPYDNDCIIMKDMEKCRVEGCERWCSTLVECSLHAQLDMRVEDD